jgi:hypothetical protein
MRRDTEQTVAALKAGLVVSGLDCFSVDGLNINGRNCVFLALLYGIRPNDQGQRIVHDRDNGGAAVDLGEKAVQDIRNMCADHVLSPCGMRTTRGTVPCCTCVHEHAYMNMPDAPVEDLRDAYCNAIRGVGVAPMHGDQGVQVAVAARNTVTVLSVSPPRSQANRTRNQMYRPFIFGSAQVARVVGERDHRTPCLMIMYVLADGVGHAEPVRARRPDQGRPSRFTGVDRFPRCLFLSNSGPPFPHHLLQFNDFYGDLGFFGDCVGFKSRT